MKQPNQIIDGKKDRLRYKFWMFATLGSAGTGVLLFPYLTYLVMRIRQVRNGATKLGIGMSLQLFAIAFSFRSAAYLEQAERHILEQYVVGYLINPGQLVYIDAMKQSNHL